MVAKPLSAPSENFADLSLDILEVSPSELFRISRFNTGEPYFGTSKLNRFDDPTPDEENRYGTCYLGFSLTVAFAESVLHDAVAENGNFYVSLDDLENRYALQFTGPTLRLANITGAALLRLGGNAELAGCSDYRMPQSWSKAVYEHPDCVDGFIYMSRLLNDAKAVVLFNRGHANNMRASDVKLSEHIDFMKTMIKFSVKAG